MDTIKIVAPAHLHTGNIDITGDLDRLYGTVGFTIDCPRTVVEVSKSEAVKVTGEDSDSAISYVKKFIDKFNVSGGAHVSIRETIPVAVGMGSQTALALSIGLGMSKLYGLDVDIPDLALAMGRGDVTALGVNSFRKGGFIVDGGYRIKEKGRHVPPLIFRSEIPGDWLFVVCTPKKPIPEILKIKENEDQILAELEPMDRGLSCELSRVVLMQMLPAIMEQDIKTFGKSITALNRKMGPFWGDYQKDVYCHPLVTEGIKMMEDMGAYGVCQSCWGPTFYGLLDSVVKARNLVEKLDLFLRDNGGGDVFYTTPNNTGAYIRWLER